ncbi:MAG TPA: biotin--[acetyl-CoA-carboxylase] ligase [Gemmatimonadaceae bacterium]|nr:biotin--[acetyl-CoA-carboxylase] ligase [Gemmatimonadaceae bacterium]
MAGRAEAAGTGVRDHAPVGEGDAVYDGLTAADVARTCGVPRAVVLRETTSTLDVAHALADAGAPEGTLVLADRQTAGRGRQGRPWHSAAGAGLWLTLVARDVDPTALAVLSIRLGLAAAPVLDDFAAAAVRLKWPNDLHVAGAKLAGLLCEGRWRGGRLEWVALGMGVNVVAPAALPAAGLRPGVRRIDVLARLVPALRGAAARCGLLDASELAAYAARDLARGRPCREPLPGVVEGVGTDGALRVRTAQGVAHAHSGSLVLDNGPA